MSSGTARLPRAGRVAPPGARFWRIPGAWSAESGPRARSPPRFAPEGQSPVRERGGGSRWKQRRSGSKSEHIEIIERLNKISQRRSLNYHTDVKAQWNYFLRLWGFDPDTSSQVPLGVCLVASGRGDRADHEGSESRSRADEILGLSAMPICCSNNERWRQSVPPFPATHGRSPALAIPATRAIRSNRLVRAAKRSLAKLSTHSPHCSGRSAEAWPTRVRRATA